MKGFDGYLSLLPGGAGGHADDPERLHAGAALQGWEGWGWAAARAPAPRRGPRPGARAW